MVGTETGLRDSGRSMCNALSELLIQSVHTDTVDSRSSVCDTEVHEVDVRDMVSQHGFVELGEGSGRVVYRVPSEYTYGTDSVVVKFSRPLTIDEQLNGTVQNEYEGNVWENEADFYVGEYLCPVYDSPTHTRFVTMPECTILSDMDERVDELLTTIEEAVTDTQYEFELNKHNVGVMPDRSVVIVDYGIPNINYGTDW